MANGNGGGGMMIVILIGGVCCLSVICLGGLGLMYALNQDFKDWVNGLFGGGGGGVSDKAGQWVCPDLPDTGMAPYNLTEASGVYWCEHPDSKTSTDPNIKNNFRASKLPPKAKKGKTYDKSTIESDDGGGIYGPSPGGSTRWGYVPSGLKFTA